MQVSPANEYRRLSVGASQERALQPHVCITLKLTALANGRSRNEERLARWLLMADDRIDGGELPLTHKLLAIMLGVYRPAVTVAVQALERRHLIKAGRRAITVLDRKGLVRALKRRLCRAR